MKLVLAAALLSFTAVAAPLNGLYTVGDLGVVEFSTNGTSVVGKLRAGNRCLLSVNTVVVQGALDGATFAGTVTVCQEGASCGSPRVYPLLAVGNDGSFAGFLRVDRGCSTPALKDKEKLLVIRPASPEEVQRASRKLSRAEAAQAAADAMLEANHLLELNREAEANARFREAMEFDETRWDAFLGYGITELHLHQPEAALAAFERAESIAEARKVPKSKIAGVHYNRACALAALKRTDDAIAALRAAIKLSSATMWIDGIENDPDLEPLRSDVAFRKFAAEAQLLARKKK